MVASPPEFNGKFKVTWQMLIYLCVMAFMVGVIWTELTWQDRFFRAELEGLRNDMDKADTEHNRRLENLENEGK